MSRDGDALALGVRLANLLETGRRESTYKIALLTGLLQNCVEREGKARLDGVAADARDVSILDLADRCIELYWRQIRPFRGQVLPKQTKGGAGKLLPAIVQLREAADLRGLRTPHALNAAEPDFYRRERRTIAHQLAAMPLTHLQHAPGESGDRPFLYDDSWLHKKITFDELDDRQWCIELRDGVGPALAQLSSLLVPVLEMLWLSEVRRLNGELFAETEELADHLFGARRTDLEVVRAPLLDLQQGQCFYCRSRIASGQGHVDHVLPWSRTSLDALANLVVADPACNAAKSDLIPVARHIGRALFRSADLEAGL